MCVRWGGVYSSSFTVTNGVRQGGILSSYLFNVYVDDLSVKLNSCHVGCYYSGGCINHLMYADDLVIMSPSVAGLYKLLHICESFGLSHDVLFNNKKSTIMSFRAGNLKDAHLPLYLLLKLRSPRDYVGSSVRACGTSLVRWMALQCANRTASKLAKRIVYEIRLIAIREVSPPFGRASRLKKPGERRIAR